MPLCWPVFFSILIIQAKTMAKPFQALLLRDVAQPPYFWTVSPKGNNKKSDFTWSRVCQLLPQVYEPAEHKICVSPFTQNGPLS